MTIKRAKELCKEQFNRLPRMGREMLVLSTTENMDIRGLDNRIRNGNYAVEYWLQNNSGKYSVRKYTSAFPVSI